MSNILARNFSRKEILIFSGIFLFSIAFLWSLFYWLTPPQTFLIILIMCFSAIIFINPKLGLFALILLRPMLDIFTDKAIFTFENHALNLASLLAILAISLSVFTAGRSIQKIKSIPLKTPIFLFILLTLFFVFFSINTTISITEWLRILSIFSLYALGFVLIENKNDFLKLIYAIVASVIIPAAVAFYQYFTRQGMTIFDEGISNRIFGTFAHPNLFAYYLTIPLALLAFIILKKNKSKLQIYFSLIPFFLILILLALTYTRGAWAVFLITVFIIGITSYRKILAGFLFSLLILYFLVTPLQNRVENLFQYNPYGSIQWRINLWKDGFQYFEKKPLLGYGTGTANELIMDKRGSRFGSPDPHNDYLKIALENGLVGLLAYFSIIIFLLFNLFKGYIKSKKTNTKILFLIAFGISIALYFMSFADNIFRNTALQWTFWLFIGALFSVYKNNQKVLK